MKTGGNPGNSLQGSHEPDIPDVNVNINWWTVLDDVRKRLNLYGSQENSLMNTNNSPAHLALVDIRDIITKAQAVASPLLNTNKRKSDDAELASSPESSKKVKIQESPQSPKDDDLQDVDDNGSLHLMRLPPEMLEQIASNLRLPSLKALRLVTSTWNTIATRVIIKQNVISLPFRFESEMNRYARDKLHKCQTCKYDRRTPLNDLTLLLKNSSHFKNFPCTSYKFTGGDLKNASDVQEFLFEQGKRIKTLHISFEQGGTKKDDVFHILQYQTPNVDTLLISHLSKITTNPILHNQGHQVTSWSFPALKTLKLGSPNPSSRLKDNPNFLIELLAASPNIENFEPVLGKVDTKFLDVFISTNKIHLIKVMSCFPTSRNIDILSRFADCRPQLKHFVLSIKDIQRREVTLQTQAADLLSKILDSSQNNLELICPFSHLGLLRSCGSVGVKWPVMRKINQFAIHLRLYFENVAVVHSIDEYSFFPDWFDLISVFPSLCHLLLTGFFPHESIPEVLQTKFPYVSPNLNIIKHLSLNHIIPPLWLEQLPGHCPQLEKLTLHNIYNFPKICQAIWNFTSITSLVLEINVGDNLTRNCFPALDSAFTGFTEDTCRLTGFLDIDDQEIEILRVNPSILKLQKLKILKIKLRDHDVRVKESYKLLTGNLTGRYALKMMTNSQFQGQVKGAVGKPNMSKMWDSLQSMKPYAKTELKAIKKRYF